MTDRTQHCPLRNDGFALSGAAGPAGVVLRAANGRELRLGPLEARLWQLCDGAHDAAAIGAALGAELGTPVTTEMVWRALDGLADAGLLADRPAPPASPARVDRRGFLRRTWPGLALAGSAVVPGVGLAQAVAATSAEEDQKLAAESQTKQGEHTQKLRAQEEKEKRRQRLRSSTEQNQKVSEQGNKVQAEQRNKADRLASLQGEQRNKATEHDNKAAYEQTAKSSALQEHQNKLRSAESDAKAGREEVTKADFESSLKASSREEASKFENEQSVKSLGSLSELAGENQSKDIEQAGKNSVFEQFLFTSEESSKVFLTDAQLDAIPEPAPLALFGAALAALAVARYAGKAAGEEPGEPGENASSGK